MLTIPRIDDDTVDPLLFKLYSALNYVHSTCILGSSNKIEHVYKTLGWSYASGYRGSQGYWAKACDAPAYVKAAPTRYDPSKDALVPERSEWHFVRMTKKITLKKRFNDLDPLNQSTYGLDKKHRYLLKSALKAYYNRQANCGDLCSLVCKYLWERPQGIHTIQLIKCNDFDHVFVLVNAKGCIEDPTSWGDAWIVDPWAFKDGIIFHASEFIDKFKDISVFVDEQLRALDRIGYEPPQGCIDIKKVSTLITCIVTINPTIHLYPSLGEPSVYGLEYYYEIDNLPPREPEGVLPETLVSQKFQACLDLIQNSNSSDDKINSILSNRNR